MRCRSYIQHLRVKRRNIINLFQIIMKLRFFNFILLFLFISASGASAQMRMTPPERVLSVDMSKSTELPADLIIFSISMNAEADTPQEAFKLHKEREKLLASLLKDFNIDSKSIKFQPVQISKRYRNNNETMYSQTSQQVRVTFSDFDIYEQIQLTLIENGFDSFSGSFSSEKLEEGKQKALELAIEAAKEKAAFIAETSGVKLGQIRTVNYSEYQINTEFRAMSFKAASADAALLDIPQSVSVTAGVSITWSLAN